MTIVNAMPQSLPAAIDLHCGRQGDTTALEAMGGCHRDGAGHNQEGFEHRWLVNPETDETVYWSSDASRDDDDPDDLDSELITIDPLPSHVWYKDMADFAEGISDVQAQRRLRRAIRGRGAFRHQTLVRVWQAFRDNQAQRRAVEWLVANNLVDEAEAERFLATHPEPELP